MLEPHRSRLSALFLSVVFATFSDTGLSAADRITVRLHGGRHVEGELDPRTNEDALWLRVEYSSIVLSSSYAWSRVEALRMGSAEVTPDRVRLMARGRKTSESRDRESPSNLTGEEALIVLPRRINPGNPVRWIESLWAMVQPANWDRDAEIDGWELCVVPRDGDRQLVPVQGHLTVARVPPRASASGRRHSTSASPRLRWSIRVQAEDFRTGCAIYRLPFRKGGNTLRFPNRGVVKLRLLAYGQGTFAAEAQVEQSPHPRW